MRNATIFLLLLVIILNICGAMYSIDQFTIYDKASRHHELNFQNIDDINYYMQIISVVQMLIYFILLITFSLWGHEVHENLENLNIKDYTYQHSQIFWALIIPIVNMYRPYKIMQEVWKGTTSTADNWKQQKGSTAIKTWWTFFVLTLLCSYISGAIMASQDNIEAFKKSILLLLAADITLIISSIFAVKMILTIDKLQFEKYKAIKSNS